jgi:hypothetical protein
MIRHLFHLDSMLLHRDPLLQDPLRISISSPRQSRRGPAMLLHTRTPLPYHQDTDLITIILLPVLLRCLTCTSIPVTTNILALLRPSSNFTHTRRIPNPRNRRGLIRHIRPLMLKHHTKDRQIRGLRAISIQRVPVHPLHHDQGQLPRVHRQLGPHLQFQLQR